MKTRHAAVWIDHKEAQIFFLHPESLEIANVHAPNAHLHRHASSTREHDHPADAARFFHDVARALDDAEEILILGPAHAKRELKKYAEANDKPFAARILGVEAMDHPTSGEIAAFARKYFLAKDRVRPA